MLRLTTLSNRETINIDIPDKSFIKYIDIYSPSIQIWNML